MSRLSAAAAVILAGALATACATVPASEPALLQYARQDCASAPDLSAAISLTPDKQRAVHSIQTRVDGNTPCLHRAGRSTPYLLYALPSDFGDKTLIVGGLLEAQLIFSPEVTLLTASGEVSRTFAAHEYFYRGSIYSVQFRPRETEAYVLVTNEPSRIGRIYNSILTGTQATPVPAGPVMFMVNSGTEAQLSRTFSYNGHVSVTINDSDTEEGQ